MLRILAMLMLLSLSLAPSVSSAFDGNRKGFVMGMGLGVHVVDVSLEAENGNHAGISSSFRLGYGINDRLQVYYVNNVSWYNRDGFTVLYGLSGLGASFFLTQSLPAFYLTGALGYASYDGYDDDVSLFDDSAGFVFEGNAYGYMLGAGLEIKKHISVEALFYTADIEADQFVNSYKASTLQLNINLLFY